MFSGKDYRRVSRTMFKDERMVTQIIKSKKYKEKYRNNIDDEFDEDISLSELRELAEKNRKD